MLRCLVAYATQAVTLVDVGHAAESADRHLPYGKWWVHTSQCSAWPCAQPPADQPAPLLLRLELCQTPGAADTFQGLLSCEEHQKVNTDH